MGAVIWRVMWARMEVAQGVFNGGSSLLVPFTSGQCTDKSESPSATVHLKTVLVRMQQGQKSLSTTCLPHGGLCVVFFFSFSFDFNADSVFYFILLRRFDGIYRISCFFGRPNDFVVLTEQAAKVKPVQLEICLGNFLANLTCSNQCVPKLANKGENGFQGVFFVPWISI